MTTTTSHPQGYKRVKTPTVLQMEAVECGAAALSIILQYYGRIVPLEQLRSECGVSRDGSKASNLVRAAERYKITAKGFKLPIQDLHVTKVPFIVFWNFNHFLVVEGFTSEKVWLNDPASGPRVVTYEEFDASYTGVVLTFEPTPEFEPGGKKPSLIQALRQRLTRSEGALAYVVIASLLLIVPGLAIPAFSRVFVDDILIQGNDWLTPLLFFMGVSAIVMGGLTWLQQTYLLRLETKLSLVSSSQFFWHVFHLPVEFFNQRYAGDISNRVTINDKIAVLLSRELATTLLSLLLIAFYGFLMLQYDVVLTVVGVLIAGLNLVALRYFSRKRVDLNQRLGRESSAIMGVSMNGLQIIETLKATGAESDFFAKWAGYHAKSLNAEQQLNIFTKILLIVPAMLFSINTSVLLIVGGLRVVDGTLTIGMLIALQALMASFLLPINDLVMLGSRLQEVEGDMTRLDDVLRYQPDAQFLNQADASAFPDAKLAGYIDLRQIEFGYSTLAKPLIRDFNLSIKPGSRVAIVGSTGSGKSTISRIITGIYTPWAGELRFDNKLKNEIPRAILTNSIGVVDQNIFMFEGTIRENLTLWDNTIPLERVIQAAKDAAIHEDIVQRPGGYDSPVEENGRNFSGGQRQRLEIARALVKDPTILILDEATSALDPVTEKTIDANLRRRGCTCIIIAHRLSTIRDADEILVMENGVVVQRGKHDQLVRAGGAYARLVGADETPSTNRLSAILDKLG